MDHAVLACAVLLAAAFVQAALGFGFALVAMTLLALMQDVVHAAAVVNVAGSVLILVMSLALWRDIAWPYVRRVLPWVVLGVLGGVTSLTAIDRALAVRLLGVCIVAIAGWNLRGAPAPTGTASGTAALAGFASGLLGGAFNQGGPPLIAHLYRRPYAPEALKATAQLIFLATGIVRLPIAAAQGHFSAAVWWEALLGTPFVALGMFAGLRAARHLDADRFRRLSWLALCALGTYLALRP